MNPIAEELNAIISNANPDVYGMLSDRGKQLYFPRGILSQGAEAKQKAFKYNATIGIATEHGIPMHLSSVMSFINLDPEHSLNYAPSFGVMKLRQAWKAQMFSKNPSLTGKEVSLPIVTNGITHGLSVTADMWIDKNDVVIMPDKIWGNYTLILTVLHGAVIKQYPLFSSDGGFNLSAFEAALEKQAGHTKKIIVLLNFPNNPTGYTPTLTEGKRIQEILITMAEKGNNVLALIDDAYFGLFYDEHCMKESMFALLAASHPRMMAIKLDGATKETYVWGLRVGFVTYGAVMEEEISTDAYDALERKTAGAVRGSISNDSNLSQSIILGALTSNSYPRETEEKLATMLDRARRVKKVLANARYGDAWEVYPFNSGYFMCLKLKTVDPEKLRLHLLDTYGVGVIALGKTDIRVAFSCVEEGDIPELFELIYQGVKDLEKLPDQ